MISFFAGKFHGDERASVMANHRIEHNKSSVLIQDFCGHTKHFPEHQRQWKPFLSALEHYKQFHHSQLMVLEQHHFDIMHNKSPGSIRTLTWSCDHGVQNCSGLGARSRHILSAFIYALITNRVFLIHLGDIDKSVMLIETNKINWSFFSEKLGMHKYRDFQLPKTNRSCSNIAPLQRLLKSNTPHVTLSLSFSDGLCPSVPWIRKALKAVGLSPLMKQRNFFDQLSGVIFRFLFTLPGNLVADAKHLEKSFGLQSRNYVSVHIRTGFVGSVFEEKTNTTPKKIQKNKDSWDDKMKCSLKLANERVGKNSLVFLATDSHNVKELALKKYSRRIRTLPIKNIVHSDHSNTWKGVDSSAFRDMWTDILLLAKGKLIVLSHSGFSRFALQLCSQQPVYFC